MLQINKSILRNYAEATRLEWLETNGLGGWSGSTLIGCNSRRYHSLLMAATVPPAERMSLVSKLDETIIIGDMRYELGTNNYGNTIYPDGYRYLASFSRKLFPEFEFEVGGIRVKKTIAMIKGENTVVIEYEVLSAPRPFKMELLPLISVRGYHSLMQANDAINKEGTFNEDVFKIRAYEGTPEIFIKVPGSRYHPEPNWFYNFHYAIEQSRGLDFVEDLFTPGKFSVEFQEGDRVGIIVSTDNPLKKEAHKLLATESHRRHSLLADQPSDEIITQLVLAADQFIVKRNIPSRSSQVASSLETSDSEGATIIAGYHWFTDWGRDTMISLPGLCLSTGRFDDARKILSAFGNSVSMGMLPNRFRDYGELPEYNNVDGTLWYFIAVYRYLKATGDKVFVLNEILPVLKDIIDWHFRGTRYNIHVTEDGLLYAGETGVQLTWMDAKIGSWVVTPRIGKPVEIQALWFNALKIFAELLEMNDQGPDAAVVNLSAAKAKHSFNEKFWYAQGNYLYDNIDENENPITEIRPNQLFAISLPFALLSENLARSVLKVIDEQLYTTVGLKSLSRSDTHYIPVYDGDTWHRDSSYHEGTVWSWLLGPYIDAIMSIGDGADKQDNPSAKEKAIMVIKNFAPHLNEACIGSVSEIFDAEPPHHPAGCVAQAWGVAELLRVIREYELYEPGKNLIPHKAGENVKMWK